MYGVKNTSYEILSIHSLQVDAERHKDKLGGSPLVVVEDTKENLLANLKQDD